MCGVVCHLGMSRGSRTVTTMFILDLVGSAGEGLAQVWSASRYAV